MADDQGNHVENHDDSLTEHDPHFEPIITLPEVAVSTLEEDEVEMIKLRAKLFRYDKTEVPPEWKERGTGDIKLLRHTLKNCVRVVMRRDKTLKLCANHYVTPWMELKPSHGSDRAWVYSVEGDYADGEIKRELLAVRFANAENAKKWKDKFEEAKAIVEKSCLYDRNGSRSQADHSEDESDDSKLSDKEASDSSTPEKSPDKEEKKEEEEEEEEEQKELTKDLEKLKVEEKPVTTEAV
ncbi:ran-specific GTPase-activating protein [Anabrus simplex]|uniref:ran-specific GTPase-activating protein n=1 Tax=Anabrus simplex TaxID=316456 RepID=UPI0035A3C5BC